MKKLRSKITKIIALVMVITIQTTMLNPVTASAAELPNNQSEVQQVEASTRSRTLDAIGDGTITIYLLGEFRFTGYNTGVYNTVNASRMKFVVDIKPLPGESVDFAVWCQQYGGTTVGSIYGGNYGTLFSDGYYRFESDWFNVVSGVDYRFLYRCNQAGIYDEGTMDIRVYAWVQ